MGSHQVAYSEARNMRDDGDVDAAGAVETESETLAQGNVSPAVYPVSGPTNAVRELWLSPFSEQLAFIKEAAEFSGLVSVSNTVTQVTRSFIYPSRGVPEEAWDFPKILLFGMSMIPGFKLFTGEEMIRRAANAGGGNKARDLKRQRYLANVAKQEAERLKRRAEGREAEIRKGQAERQAARAAMHDPKKVAELRATMGAPPPLYSHIPLDSVVSIRFVGHNSSQVRILGWSADGTKFLFVYRDTSVELIGRESEIAAGSIRALPKYPHAFLKIKNVHRDVNRLLDDPNFLASQNAETIIDPFKLVLSQLKLVLSEPHQRAHYESLLDRLRSAHAGFDKDSPLRRKLLLLAKDLERELSRV